MTYTLTGNKNIYVACKEMDFEWEYGDVLMVKSMYNKDFTLLEMSSVLSRHTDEIALLIIDLSRNGEIKPRAIGVYGNRE